MSRTSPTRATTRTSPRRATTRTSPRRGRTQTRVPTEHIIRSIPVKPSVRRGPRPDPSRHIQLGGRSSRSPSSRPDSIISHQQPPSYNERLLSRREIVTKTREYKSRLRSGTDIDDDVPRTLAPFREGSPRYMFNQLKEIDEQRISNGEEPIYENDKDRRDAAARLASINAVVYGRGQASVYTSTDPYTEQASGAASRPTPSTQRRRIKQKTTTKRLLLAKR